MKKIESLKELRVVVEGKVGRGLSEEEWKGAEPDYDSPYGAADIKEVLGFLGYKPKPKTITSRSCWHWLWPWQWGQLKGTPFTKFRWGPAMKSGEMVWGQPTDPLQKGANELATLGQSLRQALGLSTAAPFDKLKEVLILLGASDHPSTGFKFLYPVKEPSPGERVYILELDSLYAPPGGVLADRIFKLTDYLARVFDWHLAEALAFLLCGKIPVIHSMKLFKVGSEIIIKVIDPELPAQVIAQAYSEVRKQIFGQAGTKARKRIKPLGERTKELLKFCAQTPRLSWNERLQQWNEKHPKWRYTNTHIIMTIVSRARKKPAFGLGGYGESPNKRY